MKTVLVTGGARGIGRAIVCRLAEKKYNILLDYNSSEVPALEMSKEFKNVKIFRADVTDRNEVHDMVEFAKKKFGQIDILINNAGVASSALIQDTSFE